MCEVVCDDGVEGQMGARRSDCDLCTHTHTHTHSYSVYNACNIYEHPKKAAVKYSVRKSAGEPENRVSPTSAEKLMWNHL